MLLWVALSLACGFGFWLCSVLTAGKVADLERGRDLLYQELCRARNDQVNRSNRNVALIARARERGPVFHEDPTGRMVPLVGLEELGNLWPDDVR